MASATKCDRCENYYDKKKKKKEFIGLTDVLLVVSD